MTRAELRAYLVTHPNDPAAFYTFVDPSELRKANRATAEASPETYAMPQSLADIENVKRLIQQKVNQAKR